MKDARKRSVPGEAFCGTTVDEALRYAARRHPVVDERKDKKNFAQTFSTCLASLFANALRKSFPGISPDADGKRQERRARTAKGFKKLDVNYSTSDLGLALGVSIKTINSVDKQSARYTKNYTRVDAELRAEATDYHRRQPFAVLIAVIFLPIDAADDAGRGTKKEDGISSLGAAVRTFRSRAGRHTVRNDYDAFERVFIGVYDAKARAVEFLDVERPPPRARRPKAGETLSFEQVVNEIQNEYRIRNDPPFEWAP